MPTCYFDFEDERTPDSDGLECRSLEEAELEAALALADELREQLTRQRRFRDLGILIRNEGGALVGRVKAEILVERL